MSKDMCSVNRPNFNSGNRLTPNGGGPRGTGPDRLWRGTRPSLRRPRGRRFGDSSPLERPPRPRQHRVGPEVCRPTVAELAAPPGRPSCAVGAVAVDLAADAPAAGVGTEASSRCGTGPDVELDVRWTAEASARIWGRGEVLAAGERARAFTPDDQVAGG